MIDISSKSFTPPLLVPADRARDSPIISSSTGKLLTDFDAKQSPRFASKYQSRYRTRGKPRKLYPTTHALINYYPFHSASFLLLFPFFLSSFFFFFSRFGNRVKSVLDRAIFYRFFLGPEKGS